MLLEGGYDLKALGESVANTFLGEKVLGAEWQARTVSLHRQYGCGQSWCCRTSDAAWLMAELLCAALVA
jgi:acetoin utilization deacetylase AcuC-like enzyme